MLKRHTIVGTSSSSYLTKCGLHVLKWRLSVPKSFDSQCKRCAKLEAIEKDRRK